MMNYIWLGLIVIAIAFAGWKDLSGDDKPFAEPPAPAIVADFDSADPWPGTELDETVNDGAEAGASLRLAYSFASPTEGVVVTEQSVEPALPLVAEGPAGNIATVSVASDVAGHLVYLEFSDKDGERFGTVPVRLSGERKWQRLAAAPADLKPMPQNPTASADGPLVLERVAVRRSTSVEALEGSLWIDRVALEAPKPAAGDHPPDTWMGVLTKSAADRSASAIELALSLVGIMTLWLGLMRIAEKAGLVQVIAKVLKPIMVFLFPAIPANSDAMGAIVMNVAANMLGLGNAATPMGIKAMKELQKHNKYRDYASNAQCMLLSINTSSVTLIPTGIMAYRAAAGSTDLMKFWPAMVGATFISTIVAVVACKLLEKLPTFAIPGDAVLAEESTEEKSHA